MTSRDYISPSDKDVSQIMVIAKSMNLPGPGGLETMNRNNTDRSLTQKTDKHSETDSGAPSIASMNPTLNSQKKLYRIPEK